MNLKEETRDTYEALKEARGKVDSRFPVFTVESYNGGANSETGEYHGAGYISSCMEFQYTGALERGQLLGEGRIAWANGYKVQGTFAEGVPNGHGVITWTNGDKYEGDLVNGVRHGQGKLVSHNGKAVYEGTWFRSRRHGKGRQQYTDGSVYVGDWDHDSRHGMGTMTYANKDCYEGQWERNERHGAGSMGWKRGTDSFVEMYDGNWDRGSPHGKGVSTYIRPLEKGSCAAEEVEVSPRSYAPPIASVINVYRGNFSRGSREGVGTFYYADGSAYEGEWKHNKKNGRGKFINYNGVTYYCSDVVNDVPQTVPPFLELRNAAQVPEVYLDDICGIPDGSMEQLSTTIQSLLLRFNTPLRSMFSAYANQRDNVSFVFTPENWWKHRLPSRISIPQFLRLLSDKHVLSGLVSIGTVVECIVRVLERESEINSTRENYDPASDHKQELKAKVYRLQGSLNYRQFAETIIRLAPKLCVGSRYHTLGEKFNSLVVEQLMANSFTEPLCRHSRDHLSIIRPFLPQLEAKFNALVDLELDSRSRVLVVQNFLRFTHALLDRFGITYDDAVSALFPQFQAVLGSKLPPGYNQPQSDLSVTIFFKGCGDNNDKLIAGTSVNQLLTIVDFVEALVILAFELSAITSSTMEEILEKEILALPI